MLALAFLALLALPAVARAGCAAAAADPLDDPFEDEATEPEVIPDSLECINRHTFRFNMALDRWVIDPVARGYALVVPQPARRAVRRILANLDSPAVFVNDILQFEADAAVVTLSRFFVNTTIGVAGIFDVAEQMGMEEHHADFGQTLALYGVPSGSYLVLPAVGPSTARDAAGYVVDFFFRPTTYVLTPGAQILVTSFHEGSVGISMRDAHAGQLRALEAGSIDYYAALRSAYTQDRAAQIWSRQQREATD